MNGPTSAVAGEPVAISWTITNTGVDATPGSTWSDSVYLSNDSVLDASDALLGTFPHNAQLPPNGSYTQSRGITIPAGTMGAYHVIVKTDSSTRNDVFEFQAENNNTSALDIEVSLAPPADLEVAEINAPISAWSGQDFHIEWTSVNSGGTPANSKEAGWYDSVYLSRDAYLDPTTDLHLGSVLHAGILQPDATYTGILDVRLPVGLSGPYYIFVFTDSTNRVAERGAEGNNFLLASPTLQINLTPPADLVPTRVAPPSTVIAGEPALWEYEVTNNGTLDAMGAWYDTLYLSADASWDVDDARVARVYHKGDLAHGEHYDQAVTAAVPAVLSGEYYLIVRTDILDQVRESAQDETNNAAASVEKVTVSYHELSAGGDPVTGQINTGERRYFEIPDVVADGNLVLNLNVASAEATSELYIRYGEPPTRSLYDVTAKDRTGTGQLAVIPTTQGGTYYVLVYGDHLPESSTDFSIEAYLADFAVYDTSYGRGGAAGNLTIEINGAGFDRSVTAQLDDGAGFQLNASEYYFVDGTKLYATFDLTKTAPGTYDVVVHNGDGAEVTVEQSLEVVEGGGGTNRPEINVPSLVRWGREFQFTVTWGNDGLNDALAPLLTVGGSQPFGFAPGDDESAGTSYTFLGTNTHGGPPGILRPGQRETVTFFSVADPDAGDFNFYVDRGCKDAQASFDWDSIRDQLSQLDLSSEEFDEAFARMREQVGNTCGDYLRMLSLRSSQLPSVRGSLVEVNELTHIEFDSVLEQVFPSISGTLQNSAGLLLTSSRFRIRATELNSNVSFFADSLGDGSFVIPKVTPGVYALSVEDLDVIDVTPAQVVIDHDGHARGVQITVSVGSQVEGTIFLDNAPLSGAKIALQGASKNYSAVSDANGHYDIRGVGEGVYEVVVMGSGGATTHLFNQRIDKSHQILSVSMRPGGLIEGNLHLPTGWVPDTPVFFRLLSADTAEPSDTVYGTIRQGSFSIPGLPQGIYDLEFSADGLQSSWVHNIEVSPGQSAAIDNVVLVPGATIRGQVIFDDATFIPQRAQVQLIQNEQLLTAAALHPDGSYEFSGLAVGTYAVRFSNAAFPFSETVTLDVAGNGLVTAQDIVIRAGSVVTGLVTDTHAQLLLGMPVTLIGDDSRQLTTVTNEAGRYVFANLPQQRYRVLVASDDPLSYQEVDAAVPGQTYSANLTASEASVISGRVTTADGVPVSGGIVRLYDDVNLVASAITSSEGQYWLRISTEANFTLVTLAGEGSFPVIHNVATKLNTSLVVDVIGGSDSLNLHIDSGGTPHTGGSVSLYQTTPSGRTLVASVELDGQDEVLFTGLVSDSYDIHIVTDDDRVGETSVIVDGATELVVTLDTAASIRGNVVDNAGKFIPGARVTVRADDGVNLNSVVSGDDGDFQIVGLTPGVYTVVVSRVGYTPKLISTLVDGLTSANIQLQPSTTRLHGRVNDTNGQAVANAVITLADASNVTLGSVVTRGDGVFEIDAPQVDGLQISVLSDGAHPVIVHPATLVVGVNELESVEITRFVATSKGDQLQRVAPQTTLQGFGDGTLAVSGISLPTWLTQLFVDYDRSEEHLDEGDVPPLPTGECGQRCSSKRSDVLTAIQYQDRKLEQVHNAEDVLDPTVWLAAAVIVRDLSVAVGTAATAALSIESLLALIPALEIAAPSASATQAIVLASSAMFESINSVILKLDEIPLAKTPEASYAKAAEAVGILANVHTFVNAKVEVILRSIGDNPPAAFDNFNAGLGIIQTVLYLMGGVQKAAQQVAQVTLDVAEAEEVFEREKLAYESAAHSARVYLFRYLGCLKQPCDPCDGPNPPANCDGHDDDGGGGGGGSHDPNDKLGPEGYDVFGFIKPNTVLAYTVRFENDAKATASAVLVTITDQLDSDDDWNTFQLGNMQFDDHVIEVPPGLTYFETRIDLRPEGNNLFVDIVGEFNSDTGLAQWSFTGVDPTTGELTDDPLAGFLPPNNPDIHDGEGYVQYSVYPKIDLETAAQITNVATIVFDWNEPIDTPLVTNTIDAGLPASAVDFLPNQVTEKVFQVSWAGTDDADGSGVRSYDIYVSVDGGSYQRWLSETTATSATFAGEFARSYAFYSVAHDNVGHVELPPLTPDAQTVTPAGTASIGDRVWLDIDADGLQDAGERGLADVIVDLFQKDGAAVGSVMTDAAGYYRFEDLDTTLQYYLVFASPAGYRFSPQNQSLDNSRDSDVDPETGQTDSFSVTPGEHVGWDAGLYEPVEIRGTLWYDANQDGNQDNIEPVLPGWTVFIDLNENGFLDDGEPSVVADENGTYQFAGLDPGAYSLREIMPSTWDQVYPGAIGASDEPQSRWALKFQDAGFLQAEGIDIQALANSVPVLVDWNNDGLEDLLVGETIGSYGKVRLYLNEGTAAQPQFGEVVYLQVDGADLVVPAAGSLGVFPRVVDWNNDARKDLLLGLNDGRVQVLVNVNTNETPEFQTGFYVEAGPLGTKSQIDVGSQATVEMADWNADGRLDLIVGAFDGQIRVFLNEGSPESPDYRNPWIVQDAMGNLSTPGGAASVAVADLDGDGRLDLVLGNSVGSLYLYRNVGSSEVPRFETGQLLKADGYDITLDTNSSRPWIDDLDGDGVTDLIVGGADGRIRVYMRDIDTDSASIYTTTSSPVDLFTPSLTDSLPLDAGAADLIGLKEFRSDARFADIDGRGLAVVVIDTGLDLDHPFFGSDQDGDGVSDRIVFQYDFADDDDDASDIVGHGSNVTSIIASSDPLHQGVAPGVDIIHLKIFSNDGYGQFADAERALQWVIQNAEAFHVAAVNLSFGDLGNWDEASRRFGIGDELAALAAMDVIVVASAGNSYATYSGTQGVAYPAADPNTIAVGAVWDGDHGGPWNFGSYGTDFTTTTDGIAVFSQRDGQLLDTFAPGAAILGADARGGTTTMTGTSQAAPFVTGVAVLAQQIAMGTLGRPLTQYEFRSLLHSTGQTIVDGDDENDSVPNTGLSFPRLDVLTLAGAIGQIDAANPTREADPAASDSSGNAGTLARTLTIPFTHRVQVVSGDVRTGVDFGNRLQNMPPDVDNQQYNVDENLNEGAEIGTVFATDPNFGDVLEFTILSCGDTCPVAILPGTGKLTVSDKSQFDYEVISHLEFTVAIKDSTGLTSEAEITINVNDVNDPPFAVYLSDNVAKERVAGATIGTLSAGDQDTGQTHTFSLVDDASLFEIVGDTLRLKADAYLDTSDGTTVDVGVMVHDSGTPAGTRLQTLAVSLLENSKPWQNPVQPLDVNGDGRVEPRDVLNIINELFQRVVIGSNGLLPRSRAAEGAGFYFDSNGDGYCAPLDALIVINFLNARAFGEGENVAALILSTDVKEPRGSDHSSQVRNNDKDETPRPLDSYFAELTRLECATPTHTRQLGESPIAEAWDEELESVVDGIASDVALGAILPC
ncbi:MAG: carboxypeptidase regulatory-like domain-containing protein [Planctomycetales bacterium]|nr:carboxypeptidase regulatory-like domain-containing protein [Planctomycetales bacterium]